MFILLVSGLVLALLLMAGIYVMQRRLKLSVSYFLLFFSSSKCCIYFADFFQFENVKGNAKLFKYLSKLQTCYSYFDILCSCLMNWIAEMALWSWIIWFNKMILEYRVSSAITWLMRLRMPSSTRKSHLQGET